MANEPNEEWPASKLSQASYKDLGSPLVVEDRFFQHLMQSEFCEKGLIGLLESSSMSCRDYSMEIDAFDLLRDDPVLGFMLLKYPSTLLPILERAIVKAQQEILNQCEEANVWVVKGDTSSSVTRVHARLVQLPPTCCKPSLGKSLSAQDVGKIWQISGTVVRTGPVQMYESARTYKCCGTKTSRFQKKDATKQKTCGTTFLVRADLEQRNNALMVPETCPGLVDGNKCPGNKFEPVEGGSVHTDYQELKLQDAASSSIGGAGHIPRSLLIKCCHDLVDRAQPGDEVVVVGILLSQWQQSHVAEGQECQVGMALSAHSVRVIAEKGSSAWKSNSQSSQNAVGELEAHRKEFAEYWSRPQSIERPMAARDFICKAVCPKLYGMQAVKLALLITLIGGVSSDAYDNDDCPSAAATAPTGTASNDSSQDNAPDAFQLIGGGDESTQQPNAAAYYEDTPPSKRSKNKRNEKVKTRRRDQSHLLLVGDPGTGKSQFLRFAAALCPRSVLTTGVGTTSAGLTCAAVREDSGKEFALEAGALVLADKGVCCIDEFGCIRESDRTTIHEAMEQQTLSVAKAGIVCKLNCRATIIAVMNPRDCLYDNHVPLSVNTGLGTPLLSRFDLIFKLVDSSDAERDSNVTTYLLNRAIQGAGFDVVDHGATKDQEEPWTMEKLRAYIAIVKERFQPAMSNEAAILLERHYEKCRSSQSNTIPVTVRFLESLIRLSQAHSRLMHRTNNIVTLQDAAAVIQIMECTAFAYGGFDGVAAADYRDSLYRDPMTIDFSDEPDLNFMCFEYRILERYGMLGFMDETRRKKAIAEVEPEMGATHSHEWQDLETNPYGQQQAATKFSTDQLFSQSQQWSADDNRGATEDHYGRSQFTQPQSKRPRS